MKARILLLVLSLALAQFAPAQYMPRPAGGSSASQVPAWTYTAGTISAGLFTTSHAGIASTTTITLGTTDGGVDPVPGTRAILTDTSGNYVLFNVDTTNGSGALTGGVQATTATGNWSGKYTVSYLPLNQTAALIGLNNVDNTSDVTKSAAFGIVADTGWTANASAGDKTAVVPDYTAAAFTGADTVSQAEVVALADVVVLLRKKVQALETALAAALRPNN